MTSVEELSWNLQMLIRNGFPNGLRLDQLESIYTRYFETLLSPSQLQEGSPDWNTLFRTSSQLRTEFVVRKHRDGVDYIHDRKNPMPQSALKIYCGFASYTMFMLSQLFHQPQQLGEGRDEGDVSGSEEEEGVGNNDDAALNNHDNNHHAESNVNGICDGGQMENDVASCSSISTHRESTDSNNVGIVSTTPRIATDNQDRRVEGPEQSSSGLTSFDCVVSSPSLDGNGISDTAQPPTLSQALNTILDQSTSAPAIDANQNGVSPINESSIASSSTDQPDNSGSSLSNGNGTPNTTSDLNAGNTQTGDPEIASRTTHLQRYSCHFCSKSFQSCSGRNLHVKRSHKELQSSQVPITATSASSIHTGTTTTTNIHILPIDNLLTSVPNPAVALITPSTSTSDAPESQTSDLGRGGCQPSEVEESNSLFTRITENSSASEVVLSENVASGHAGVDLSHSRGVGEATVDYCLSRLPPETTATVVQNGEGEGRALLAADNFISSRENGIISENVNSSHFTSQIQQSEHSHSDSSNTSIENSLLRRQPQPVVRLERFNWVKHSNPSGGPAIYEDFLVPSRAITLESIGSEPADEEERLVVPPPEGEEERQVVPPPEEEEERQVMPNYVGSGSNRSEDPGSQHQNNGGSVDSDSFVNDGPVAGPSRLMFSNADRPTVKRPSGIDDTATSPKQPKRKLAAQEYEHLVRQIAAVISAEKDEQTLTLGTMEANMFNPGHWVTLPIIDANNHKEGKPRRDVFRFDERHRFHQLQVNRSVWRDTNIREFSLPDQTIIYGEITDIDIDSNGDGEISTEKRIISIIDCAIFGGELLYELPFEDRWRKCSEYLTEEMRNRPLPNHLAVHMKPYYILPLIEEVFMGITCNTDPKKYNQRPRFGYIDERGNEHRVPLNGLLFMKTHNSDTDLHASFLACMNERWYWPFNSDACFAIENIFEDPADQELGRWTFKNLNDEYASQYERLNSLSQDEFD